MPRTPREHTLGTWGTLTTTVAPEVTQDLPHLKVLRVKLVETEAEADKLISRRL